MTCPHAHAEGVDMHDDNLVHLFAPSGTSYAACGEEEVDWFSVLIDRVTCGWCRVKAHTNATTKDPR